MINVVASHVWAEAFSRMWMRMRTPTLPCLTATTPNSDKISIIPKEIAAHMTDWMNSIALDLGKTRRCDALEAPIISIPCAMVIIHLINVRKIQFVGGVALYSCEWNYSNKFVEKWKVQKENYTNHPREKGIDKFGDGLWLVVADTAYFSFFSFEGDLWKQDNCKGGRGAWRWWCSELE